MSSLAHPVHLPTHHSKYESSSKQATHQSPPRNCEISPLTSKHFRVSLTSLPRSCALTSNSGQQQPTLNGVRTELNGAPAVSSITSGPVPSAPHPPTSPISFTPDQINALRAQIQAFKLISQGQPVPEQLQHAIRPHSNVTVDLEKILAPSDVGTRIVDAAVKMQKGVVPPTTAVVDRQKSTEVQVKDEETASAPNPSITLADVPEKDKNSGIYPYNAFRMPFTHLTRPSDMDPSLFATRLQKLLIPSVMPPGLDVHQIINERDRFIEARVSQRVRELENLQATIGDGGFDSVTDDILGLSGKENEQDAAKYSASTAHGKLCALIELKSLRLLEKQRSMRALVAERLIQGTLLPLNRADFRRVRKPTLRDARMTEQAERRQRVDRERRAKHKHVEQLAVICSHGRDLINVGRQAQDRVVRLGRAVINFHAYTEKEEQKRIERISKERLKALKADDEEAYMKLIDTAKDTRITHLLRQTDAYLDSLAQAVIAQQNEGAATVIGNFESEEGPTSEATFGAQVNKELVEEKGRVDYYAVAHRISERISKQPVLLRGGTLKDYQLKGLQWMVSLYNNKLNGILADEMASLISTSYLSDTLLTWCNPRVLARRFRPFLWWHSSSNQRNNGGHISSSSP